MPKHGLNRFVPKNDRRPDTEMYNQFSFILRNFLFIFYIWDICEGKRRARANGLLLVTLI